jgi:hypothetical protein
MNNAYFDFAEPKNETVLNYAPGSPERQALQKAVAEMKERGKGHTDVHRWRGGAQRQ